MSLLSILLTGHDQNENFQKRRLFEIRNKCCGYPEQCTVCLPISFHGVNHFRCWTIDSYARANIQCAIICLLNFSNDINIFNKNCIQCQEAQLFSIQKSFEKKNHITPISECWLTPSTQLWLQKWFFFVLSVYIVHETRPERQHLSFAMLKPLYNLQFMYAQPVARPVSVWLFLLLILTLKH